MKPRSFVIRTSIEVREARIEDVRKLEWDGGPNMRLWYESAWDAHRAGQITYLVATINEFPIAQVVVNWAGRNPQNEGEESIPDLQSLRVYILMRQMGIGTRLLEMAEKLVKQQGFRQVSLSVGVENEDAQRLYTRRGYVVAGEEFDDRWSFVDQNGESVEVCERVVNMVKPL